MLGYFSLVGLLRVHVLIGDYHSALKGAYRVHALNILHVVNVVLKLTFVCYRPQLYILFYLTFPFCSG